MIQFNLLPDIKVQFIRTKRLKQVIILISIIASAVSIVLLAVVFSLNLSQKKHLSNLDKDIASLRSEFDSNPDLNKILTVQNQINSLPDLYAKRPDVSRLPQYIEQTTPADQLGLSSIIADFTLFTLQVSGSADTLQRVNTYVDTLKFTTFTIGDETATAFAFKDVILTDFSRDETAKFTINLTFDPLIFDETKVVKLIVPSVITTRSELSRPGASQLFIGDPVVEGVQ